MSEIKFGKVEVTVPKQAARRMAILLWGPSGSGKTTLAATSPSKKLWIKWADSFTDMKYSYENDVWNPNPNGLCRRHCPVVECSHNGSNR